MLIAYLAHFLILLSTISHSIKLLADRCKVYVIAKTGKQFLGYLSDTPSCPYKRTFGIAVSITINKRLNFFVEIRILIREGFPTSTRFSNAIMIFIILRRNLMFISICLRCTTNNSLPRHTTYRIYKSHATVSQFSGNNSEEESFLFLV